RSLLVPSHLFGQFGVALGQLLEAVIGFDASDNGFAFVRPDPLTIILPVLPALQKEVRALDDGFAAAFDGEGLRADVAADQVVDAGHFFEDASAFLLNGECKHRYIYIVY